MRLCGWSLKLLLLSVLLSALALPLPARSQEALPPDYVPELLLPAPLTLERQDMVTYTIQPGDTIWDIAIRFHVTPQTIIWANGWLESDPHYILPGQELVIPPTSGVLHYVRKGETLPELAKRYGVKVEDVVAYRWNGLESADAELYVDQPLFFPGGRKPGRDPLAGPPPPRPIPISLSWPAQGPITRGFRDWHRGIDIAAPANSPVTAAAAGRVTYAGWSQVGYGKVIFIDHGYGVTTVYAHLNSFAVATGDTVQVGQIIGRVGSTGRSLGPHLHFEVRVDGRSRTPLAYLP